MGTPTSKLVLVAHPGDETLVFSSVCAGADIVSVTQGGWQGDEAAFRGACARLGGRQSFYFNLPGVYPRGLPIEALLDKLRTLGPYSRVYTHSPLEKHSHHRDLAFAASQHFDQIWVQASGGYAAEAHVLSASAFAQKIAIMNSLYAHQIAAWAAEDYRCVTEVAGVEAFVPTQFPEVVRAVAYTGLETCTDVPDMWAFETSPYEQERAEQTCAVLARADRQGSPTSILEVGACEGAMTRRLRALFPHTKIRAVEINPVFAQRLRGRLGNDPAIDVVEASVLDIPLVADLVLLAEVLYYVPEHLMDILARVRAQHVLTSYMADFDDQVALCLQRCGWENCISVHVLPRFEPIDGRASLLIVRRPGSNIRLWKAA